MDTPPNDRVAVPYQPSWVDRLTAWVDRLPGPAPFYYLATALALIFAVAASQWASGVPFPSVRPFYIFFGALVPYTLALIHVLDDMAAAALVRYRPILLATEAEQRSMAFRLRTLPAGPTLIATLLGLLVGLAFAFLIPLQERVRITGLVVSPTSEWVNSGLLVISWAMYGVLFYHTLHQLREISRVLDAHTRINLFETSPIYGFSGVTALTAVGIAVVSLGWLVTLPQTARSFTGLLPHVLFILAAIVAFLWPLLGVHRLLSREKDGLLGANARMIESVGEELHRRVEAGQLSGMAEISDTLASLEIERRLIESTPTWPWSPGTPRAVAAGLLLPLLIWGAQRVLESLLR